MNQSDTPLLTDLYQLTMAHAYFERSMNDIAVFELFVRRLPPARRFLLAAGLEQALQYLQSLKFEARDIEFLRELGSFPEPFLQHLSRLRFTGTVHAMPEGTPFFADEPIMRVTAPLIEAQLVESRLINIMHFQTLIASKAARCVQAARGRGLIDFGMRRAHEAQAAILAARAAYLAGFGASATVEAGRRFGIPLAGTMAHSFIEAHDREDEAFRNFIASRPSGVTLLIDTYDTERAARRVVELVNALERPGCVEAVRIDSGDLEEQARKVRRIFDENGCSGIRIVLSGGLDEYQIDALVTSGTPVDAFGVGTALDVSADIPSLDMAYKLQAYAGRPRRKQSPGKVTWPGAKQVYRVYAPGGETIDDCIALSDERLPGTALLTEVLANGQRIGSAPTIEAIRSRAGRELESLPPSLRQLSGPPKGISVDYSHRLRALAAATDAQIS